MSRIWKFFLINMKMHMQLPHPIIESFEIYKCQRDRAKSVRHKRTYAGQRCHVINCRAETKHARYLHHVVAYSETSFSCSIRRVRVTISIGRITGVG